MTASELQHLSSWFAAYVGGFFTGSKADDDNIELKRHHSLRVQENMARIAASIGLDAGGVALAEAVGLLHDVGRFTQYREFKTFEDPRSINHGARGAKVLRMEGVLDGLPAAERGCILRSVAFHNAFKLPPNMPAAELPYLRMVRDADKIDIWRVFSEYYITRPADRPSAADLGLPDDPVCTPAVTELLAARKPIRYGELVTLNDFKLLKLSWAYDLQFTESRRMAHETGCLERVAATLPADPAVTAAVDGVRRFLAAA